MDKERRGRNAMVFEFLGKIPRDWLFGYLVIWLFGYLGIWLLGYLGIWGFG
jgi:hypothetical protein